MLTSLVLTLAITTVPLVASPTDKDESGPPGKKEKGWVPPGLEKKGGLPPGQAKKQEKLQKQQKDREGETHETDAPVSPPATPTGDPAVIDPTKPPGPMVDTTPEVTPQPVPRIEAPSRPRIPPETTEPKVTKDAAVTTPTLDPAQARAKLDVQVRSLTKLDNNRAAAAAGWNYLGQQGGIPYSTIQQQRKAFPNLSPVAALLGNLIAQQGGVPFNKVTAERAKGRQWSALAEQYRVAPEPLVQAVDGLEKAMHAAASGSQSGTTDRPGATTPTVDAAAARAVLEQQVRTLTQLDNNAAALAAGWNYVSQQGGVSYATIQQQRKAFPNLSPAAALLGNLVSKQSGVPFNKVTAERAKGRQWGVLADEHKVSVESLSQAVAGLEKAMRDAVAAAKTR